MVEQNVSWFKLNPNYTYMNVVSFCILLQSIAYKYDVYEIKIISYIICIAIGIWILDIKNRSLWWIFTNGFLIPGLLKNRGKYVIYEEDNANKHAA